MLMAASEFISAVKGEDGKVKVFLHPKTPAMYEVDNTFEDIIK